MTEQNPLVQLLGLEPRSRFDRSKLGAPPPPPPPPAPPSAAATSKQFSDTSLFSQSPTGVDPLDRQVSVGIAAAPFLAQPGPAQRVEPLRSGALSSVASATPTAASPAKGKEDGSYRRQFDRKPMPFGGVAPVGEMTGPSGQKWHISLWDVSMGGLCVVVDAPVPEPLGSLLSISVYESFGLGSAFFKAHLRWRTTEADNTYLGLQFEDQDLLKNGCFLIDYVTTDLAAS